MLSILHVCMHFFIAYQARITKQNWSYRCESTFFGYWIKFLLILFEEHPFIFRRSLKQKSHIKMLKMALFDCAINEKCCSLDGGWGICPLFSSPPQGIWQLKSPHPQQFAIQGKKNANARGQGAGGIDRCITNRKVLSFLRMQMLRLSSILRWGWNTKGPILHLFL